MALQASALIHGSRAWKSHSGPRNRESGLIFDRVLQRLTNACGPLDRCHQRECVRDLCGTSSNFAPQSCRTRAFPSSMPKICARIAGAAGTSLSERGGVWERGIVRGWGPPLAPRFRSGPHFVRPDLLCKSVEPGSSHLRGFESPVGHRESNNDALRRKLAVNFGGERGIRTLEGLLAL